MRFPNSRFGTADAPTFLGDLIDTLTERGRALLGRKGDRDAIPQLDLVALSELLISRRGEASGVALAQALLASYVSAPGPDRLSFLQALADRFGPDRRQVERAIEAVRKDQGRTPWRRCMRRPSLDGRSCSGGSISPRAVPVPSSECARNLAGISRAIPD
jgi:hypothetical protein